MQKKDKAKYIKLHVFYLNVVTDELHRMPHVTKSFYLKNL